jgi:hypothetical protein
MFALRKSIAKFIEMAFFMGTYNGPVVAAHRKFLSVSYRDVTTDLLSGALVPWRELPWRSALEDTHSIIDKLSS